MMARERWRRENERRERLAAMNPIQYPGRIVRRIIVITNECEAKEAIFYDTDSHRDARRKLNRVLSSP